MTTLATALLLCLALSPDSTNDGAAELAPEEAAAPEPAGAEADEAQPAPVESLVRIVDDEHARPDKPRSAFVLDLAAPGLGRDDVEALSEELRGELAKVADFKIVSAADVRDLLEQQQARLLLGCDDAGCLSGMADALGTDLVVAGSIGRVQGARLVQLRMIDAAEASVVRRVSHPASADLVASVRAAARKLMQVPSMVHLVEQVAGAEVTVGAERVGRMPLSPFPVAESGSVALRVEHVDYVPYEGSLQLTPGTTTRHVVRLHRYADLMEAAAEREWWGWGLLSSGSLAAALGSGLLAASWLSYDGYLKADARTTSDATFARLESETKALFTSGIVTGSVGLALGGVAGWLLLVNPPRQILEDGVVHGE